MKRAGLIVAAAALVAADAILLIGVARNRSGTPAARLELSERNLVLPARSEDNSALALRIEYSPATLIESRRREARKPGFAALQLSDGVLSIAGVGSDFEELRRRYSDGSRYAVAPAMIGGWTTMATASVYVPPQYMHVFRGLGPTSIPVVEPRYAVTVCWGNAAEPWICGARRLK